MRSPKGFVLEEALERYADAIETRPQNWAGRWARACHDFSGDGEGSFGRVWLDLGCGKGNWISQAAPVYPDTLFIGVDAEPMCVARTAQAISEGGIRNAVVIPGLASDVHSFFGAGELSGISMNFPTPFPRKKDAPLRIVHMDRLAEFRRILAPEGRIELRTDSLPLRDFALEQMMWAGFEAVWSSDDARRDRPGDPVTEYERKLTGKGARIYAVTMVAGEQPERLEQRSSLSLMDYLPKDLSSMEYVPHGMDAAVENLKNRRRRTKESKESEGAFSSGAPESTPQH